MLSNEMPLSLSQSCRYPFLFVLMDDGRVFEILRNLSLAPHLLEECFQQLPAPRPMVHPHGLLPRRKVEEGVGQQETVFRTRAQKKEAVIVTAAETVETQHSLPGSVVRPDAGDEVTKDNSLVLFRHSR
ncbi:unnamed protein product [Schistocephalus solidus]|uniref:Uncharacterized protein n=1 Tax=Schistocephalus solidus TaxID=70667 RepID=A0A183SK33_SCHSO|nr:unnamed protein product [Schistocephalus solidus]